jgi:phosphomevalonate kinase
VVASLAALYASDCDNELELRTRVAERALTAHRIAQGGGSGIDVLASTWGTTLLVEASPSGGLPVATSIHLPDELVVEVWGSRVAASTAEMLQAVRRLEQAEPERHAQLIADLTGAAQQAANAAGRSDMPSLIKALDDQSRGLTLLGEAAHIPILTPAVTQLAELARADGDACVLPSGAGGGDVALWVSRRPSDSAFRAKASSLDHTLLPMSLQARGVHTLSDNGGPRGT